VYEHIMRVDFVHKINVIKEYVGGLTEYRPPIIYGDTYQLDGSPPHGCVTRATVA